MVKTETPRLKVLVLEFGSLGVVSDFACLAEAAARRRVLRILDFSTNSGNHAEQERRSRVQE
jgi:hypothetical protein